MVPQVSLAWLNDERNFIVRTFGKVTVTRSIRFGGAKSSKSIEVSAISKWKGRGEIQLWLAGNMEVDMHEVASSLCRVLFNTSKVVDALFLMTMLSTDLHTLQRRGYNGEYEALFYLDPPYCISIVHCIFKQRAEREAITEVLTKKGDKAILPLIRPLFR